MRQGLKAMAAEHWKEWLPRKWRALMEEDRLDEALNAIPGLVGHGLFTRYAERSVIAVGHADRVEVIG